MPRAGGMICLMRVFCFWLMIALMPLRAWAGDAMAVQMALQMASNGVSHSVLTPAVAEAECPGHAGSSSPAVHVEHGAHHKGHDAQGGGDAHHANGDGSAHNCLHCDICQGKVHAVWVDAVALSGTERELPAYGGSPMDLGPAASFFKPPIF